MDQNPAGFANEDEEATYCLSLLRDGDRQQKIVARERLSQIFEQRGLLDEAAQCLESNIREGIRDPRVYQRLAGVYRRQGRHELADEVLLEARRLAERIQRGQQSGGRRGGPGRAARGVPPPASGVQDTTRQLPNAGQPQRPGPVAAGPGVAPTSGGEFALDQPGEFGGPARPGGPPDAGLGRTAAAGPPADRPWWLSPGMVVLLILLCGPYGLAMMWVRGNYPAKARKTAVAVWAGLMVLVLAAAAVTIQAQVRTAVSAGPLPGISGLPGVPAGTVPPTPITFPPAPGAQPGATRPAGVGAVPSPPTVPGAGSLGTPSGVTISPPSTSPSPDTAPAPSPPAAAAKPTASAPPAEKPASGERVRVINTDGQGANMRERPGSTAPVVATVEEGATLEIVGADQQMDGRGWRNVRTEDGETGWIVSDLLEAVP